MIKKTIICVFCAVLGFQTFAQSVDFKHLSINDGLSQNAVFAMIQDQQGYMWFGTKDGLNKYDGYSFEVFQNNPFDTTSISSNYVTSLFEDRHGNIWVGTLSGELNIYQKGHNKFTRIILQDIEKKEVNTNEIRSIIQDKQGNIWIATKGSGLYQLIIEDSGRSKTICIQYLCDDNNTNSLSSNLIYKLNCDEQGQIWMGTGKGLNRYDIQSKKFTRYQINSKNPKASASHFQETVYSVFESMEGIMYLGTLSGLVEFDKRTGAYKVFPHHYDIYRYGWGNIIDIAEAKDGKLWLATGAELMLFDPVRMKYESFRNEVNNENSISYNSISSILIDKTEILWVGTPGMGINIYDPKAIRFGYLDRKRDPASRITGFSVRSILEDNEGFVWIGTEILYRWNRKSGELKSFEKSSNEVNAFGNTGAFGMMQASDGMIWFATSEGIFSYNPLTEKTLQFKFDPKKANGLPQKEVFAVFEDKQHIIWIATENFLSKLIDREKGIFEHFRYQPTPELIIQVRPVIFQDFKGDLWLGTKNGLLKFNEKTASFFVFQNDPTNPNSLNNNEIKSICADPLNEKKYLWIGTAGGGLNRFSFSDESFKHYTTKIGLPNNVVYSILPEDDKALWLSTNKGLSRFDLLTEQFRNYDVRDGLQSNEFNTGAAFGSLSGELFFGGINGLNYFFPSKIKDNPYVPEIVITAVKVRNKNFSSSGAVSIPLNFLESNDQILLHYDDVINIEFAALDFSASNKNQYAYKLENYNEDWIYNGSERSVTYTHLPSGRYIFKVKGSNNDGIWNEKGTQLTIIIIPPWWQTWWAYLIYFILGLTVILFIRRYELNRVKLKNQLSFEKVETDILRNLNELKSHFFANISHEFRTPLTLILGQLENVMSSEINTSEKAKLQVANQNARRLLSLINQLLDLSKIEAGKMTLITSEQNIISFLKSLFYSFETWAESHSIELTFNTDYEVVIVSYDLDKMEKVFYNLVSNAFKFTEDGERIAVSVTINDDNFVEISIIDSGIGIAEHHISHIFDRFYQIDSPRAREHEGTGIGLALAKEIVELHHGKMLVSSGEGKGTNFIVRLPMIRVEQKSETAVKLNKKIVENDALEISYELNDNDLAIEDASDSLTCEIVLIVEDNCDVRSYISEQLIGDYQILLAANGKEGLEMACAELPDLIITDIAMPKIDGYQLCKELRNDEKTSHIPIIMLTAKAGLDDKIAGLEQGADAFITKPFSSKELKVTVRKLISQRKELRKRFSLSTVIRPTEVSTMSVDQLFLEKTIDIIGLHFEDELFSVEVLAEKTKMSVSQINRKLNALIDQPAGQLIRSLRLQRAADLLRQNTGTVAEISYQLGFSDQAYFSRVFKKQFGVSPSAFKKKDD